MHFYNIRLANKLVLGFGAVLAVVTSSSVFTYVTVTQISEIERINSTSDAVVDFVDQLWGDINGVRGEVRKFVLTGSEKDGAKTREMASKFAKDFRSAKAIIVRDGPQFTPDLEDLEVKFSALMSDIIDVELKLGVDPATRAQAVAMVTSSASAPYGAALETSFKSLRDKINPWSDSWTEQGNAAMDRIRWVVAASGVASVLVGIGMAWLILRAVGRPLVSMTAAMQKLADGDTSIDVPARHQKDEVGQMAATVQVFKEAAIEKVRLETEATEAQRIAEADRARNEAERAAVAEQQAFVVDGIATGLERLADGDLVFRLQHPFATDYEKLRTDFNAAMGKLQDTMGVITSNTAAIRSGTLEISTAADDLSRRTEQQAASLEETAAALDEITATVRKTAEGATHARAVVSTAKSDAEQSSLVVGRAVEAMAGIENSSKQIGQIIGVIDEIAFQTNLLALNAGVEAARAGEAGRGFAVVASEVRALAQRSAEAAKEIKALISTSAQHVGSGVELVGETGRSLQRIMAQVTEINAVVTDIAASAQEQSTGLDQVNTAINQMDQVTQQNAAMVEQSTAASKSLAQETEDLAGLVGRFKVGERSGAARQAIARSAPAVMRPSAKGAASKRAPSSQKLVVNGPPASTGTADEWQDF